MKIFGLEPGAQIIILQAIATYAALGSASFLARPILRGQTLAADRDILSDMKTEDKNVAGLIEQAKGILNERIRKDQPSSRRDNGIGFGLLVLSLLLFSGAVILQILTDPAFH